MSSVHVCRWQITEVVRICGFDFLLVIVEKLSRYNFVYHISNVWPWNLYSVRPASGCRAGWRRNWHVNHWTKRVKSGELATRLISVHGIFSIESRMKESVWVGFLSENAIFCIISYDICSCHNSHWCFEFLLWAIENHCWSFGNFYIKSSFGV